MAGVNDRSEIDDAWGELLGDEAGPAPSPDAPAPAGEDLPPPPTFAPHLHEEPRSDSVVESMHTLMKADSGASAAAAIVDADVAGRVAELEAGGESQVPVDVASASGSMPKLWEALWADSESSASAEETREEDSVAALLPKPPVLTPAASPAADDSGVGLRLAPPLEPEAPARIGPDDGRTVPPSIEQSVELKKPPRVAEEAAPAPDVERSDGVPEQIDDVPVRASVAVAEEAPARVRPAVRAHIGPSDRHAALEDRADGSRPRMAWIGGAAVLAIAAIVGIATRGGDEAKDRGAATPASTVTDPQRPAPADPQPSVAADPQPPAAADPQLPAAVPSADATPSETPVPSETPSERPSETPEPAAAKEITPPPSDAEADPPAEDPAPPAASTPDYDAAKAEYDASGSQDALATMVKAACAMDDGPSARAAFRKLRPTELRKEALSACKKTEVDPTLAIDGPTPGELVRRARRELEAGDAAAAEATARESNRMQRSREAILLMALAACAQSDAEEVRRLRKHVARDDRAELDAACTAKGIDATASE